MDVQSNVEEKQPIQNNTQTVQNNVQSNQVEIPYDIIPLPSEGVLYPGKKPTIEVEYLTAMDENILTSPNLLQSGKFLDVLMERKISNFFKIL